MLTLFAVCSATISYAPSCADTYTINGVDFIYTTYNGTIGCQASTRYAPLTYTETLNGGSVFISPVKTSLTYNLGETYYGNGYAGGQSSWIIPLNQFETTQTLSFAVFTGISNAGWAHTWISNGTKTIEYYAASGMGSSQIINNTYTGTYTAGTWAFTNGSETINFPSTTSFNFSTQGQTSSATTSMTAGFYFNHATLNTANSTEPGTTSQLGNQSTLDYLSIFNKTSTFTTGDSMVRSNYKTGKQSNSGNHCLATLIYNGNTLITPKITVFNTTFSAASDAFADFSTGQTAYLKNNTDAWVLSSTNLWFYVPTVTCTSYSLGGTSTALFYSAPANGGTQFNSYTYNGINIGLYTSPTFCANATDGTEDITFYTTGGVASSSYRIETFTNNTISYSNATAIGSELLITVTPPENATNVTITPLNPATTGVTFNINQKCSTVAAPSNTNIAAFVVLWIIVILAAAVMESTLGLGVEAFAILSILGATLSAGFYLPGFIMALYYGLRQLKAVME